MCSSDLFFDEMWPMLKTSAGAVERYIANSTDSLLPGRSFHSSAEFKDDQSANGPLTIEFQIGSITSRRMASPYQVWMLQRLNDAMAQEREHPDSQQKLSEFLSGFANGSDILNLEEVLPDCRIEKQFEQLSAVKRR